MAYPIKGPHFVANASSPPAVTSTGVIAPNFIACRPSLVKRAGVIVTTAVVSSGSVVITVRFRPIVGSSSNQATIGTITVPAGAAAGAAYYLELDPSAATNDLMPGQQVVFDVTTAAAGGGAAGAVMPWLETDDNPQNLEQDGYNLVTA